MLVIRLAAVIHIFGTGVRVHDAGPGFGGGNGAWGGAGVAA